MQEEAPLILLVDTNGRLGSICTESVGVIEPIIESPSGEELHLFLTQWQLFAASTFWPLGQGTWQSTRGSQCRSDYVCLPLQWENDVMNCSIETELPLAPVSMEDHLAVQTTVSVWWFQCARVGCVQAGAVLRSERVAIRAVSRTSDLHAGANTVPPRKVWDRAAGPSPREIVSMRACFSCAAVLIEAEAQVAPSGHLEMRFALELRCAS